LSRIRSGGVVVSRKRLLDAVDADPHAHPTSSRKLKAIGLPHRKAAQPKKR
jgi:hypothetical protein